MLKNPDICIVGSGAAASFLAHSLKGSDLSVLILEAGNLEGNSDAGNFIHDINIDKNNHLNYGFSKQVGGSTNLWAGRVAPFETSDFEAKEKIPNSGWPISLNDLIPFYDKASKIMGLPLYKFFPDKKYHVENDGFIEKVETNNFLNIKKFIWSFPPFNTRKTILKDIIEGKVDNIQILQNAKVTQIIEAADEKRIEHVEFYYEGKKQFISPKKTILATGGIENVRILLNSTSKDESGVANAHGVVGKYFSTHPKADMGVLVLNKATSVKGPLFVDTKEDDISSRYGVGFSEKVLKRDSLLNHYVQLTPVSEHTASKLFEKIKNSSSFNSKLINKNKIISGFLPGLGLLVYEVIGRIAGLQKKSKKFILRTFLDQFPSAEHCLTLSDEKDDLGNCKLDINWSFTDADKASVFKFYEEFDKVIREQNIGFVEYSKLKEIKDWPMTAIHSHFMGGARMGDDPKTSVVNANCKAHGYENLFVLGPSIFPSYGYANPVYSLAALSLRLGEYIKGE